MRTTAVFVISVCLPDQLLSLYAVMTISNVTDVHYNDIHPSNIKLNTFAKSSNKITTLQKRDEVDNDVRNEIKFEPPDGQWGWMILLGTFTISFLSSGIIKLSGILLINIMKVFNASPLETSWILSLMMSLLNFMGPAARAICHYFSSRVAIIISSILLSSGLIMTSFATEVIDLYFSLGILIGTSAGLTLVPSIVVTCEYFRKRRGMASGVTLSGSSLGAFLLPPIMTYLIEEYSFRGAVLVLGGISLNMFVAGMLLQPVKYHMKRIVNDEVGITKRADNVPFIPRYQMNILEGSRHFIHASMTSLEPVEEIPEPDNPETPISDDLNPSSSPCVSSKIHAEIVATVVSPTSTIDVDKNRFSVLYKEPQHSIISMPQDANLPAFKTNLVSNNSSLNSSFLHLSTLHLGSNSVAIVKNQYTSDFSISNTLCPCPLFTKKNSKTSKSENVSLFDVSWMSNSIFIILGIANTLTLFSWIGVFTFLPAHMDNIGISNVNIARVLSVIALFDFIGRIIFPWLYDFGCCHIKYWYMTGVIVSGLVTFLVPYSTTFEHLMCVFAVFGLFTGCYSGLSTLIYVEMLGEENVASSYSMSLFINGFFMFGMPPFVGWFRQVTGSYGACFVAFGLLQILGGLSILLDPCASRHEVKKEFRRLSEASKTVKHVSNDGCKSPLNECADQNEADSLPTKS
ncbi:SLC16A12 (predicted) [Pycnogonum litorale]